MLNVRLCGIAALSLAAVISGCASLPPIPLSTSRDDAARTLFDNRFSGPASARSAIAPSSPYSMALQRQVLGVVNDAELDGYLNGILAVLQQQVPGTPAPARVYVTPDTGFTATSYEDGGIYLSYKVLQSLESEDEVAALIGHEYAHVLLDHYNTNWVNTAASLTYSAANMAINKKVGSASDNDLLRMALANEATLGVSQIGIMPALTREQESEADRLGLDLMLKAGYSFAGALQLMSRIQDWDARNEALAQQRKRNYINLFSANEKSSIARSIDGQIDKLEQQVSDFIRTTSRHHDQGQDRATLVRGYLKQHYRHAPRPELRSARYAQTVGSTRSRRLFDDVDSAHASSAALQANKSRDALSLAQRASGAPGSRVPFVRHTLINALAANGKGAEARTLLEQGVAQGDTLLVDNKLLLGVLEKQSPEKALALAQASYDAFGSTPELLPDLIGLNKKLKNSFAVVKFYGVCAGKAMGAANNALLESCSKAQKN